MGAPSLFLFSDHSEFGAGLLTITENKNKISLVVLFILLLVLSPQEFISGIKSNSCYRIHRCSTFDGISLQRLILNKYSLRIVGGYCYQNCM